MEENEEFKEAIRDANPAQFPDFTEIYDKLQQKAKAVISHSWRQRGPFLVCTSCDYEHSQWIGSDKKLVGFDKGGQPIIEEMM